MYLLKLCLFKTHGPLPIHKYQMSFHPNSLHYFSILSFTPSSVVSMLKLLDPEILFRLLMPHTSDLYDVFSFGYSRYFLADRRSAMARNCRLSVCLFVCPSVCGAVYCGAQNRCRGLKVVPPCSYVGTFCSLWTIFAVGCIV